MGSTRKRILVGPHINAEWSAYVMDAFDDFDALSFGPWEGVDVPTPALASLDEIVAALPKGWTPDLLVLWRPEYTSIPPGLEDAPFPTCSLISDWYVAFSDCLEAAWRVDTLVTGTRGERVYRKAGFDNVIAMPMLGYQPGLDGFYGQPNDKRDLDVYCGGNPNWRVHKERFLVHETLRTLPVDVRLLEGDKVDREEFNRRMGRAKIFIDQTVIGEINMKVYEATASGTCLFVEDTNLDIRDYLVEDESVVLFNRGNINEKILYYLEHEQERAAIAEAGQQAMAPYTYRKNLKAIVDRVLAEGPPPGARPIRELPENERLEGLAGYAVKHHWDDCERLLILVRGLSLEPRAQLIRTVARFVARARGGFVDGWDDQRILRSFGEIAGLAPHWLPGMYSWARIASAYLKPDSAHQVIDRTEEMLRGGCEVPIAIANTYFGMHHDRRFEFERAAWEALEAGESMDDALRAILLEDLQEIRANMEAGGNPTG